MLGASQFPSPSRRRQDASAGQLCHSLVTRVLRFQILASSCKFRSGVAEANSARNNRLRHKWRPVVASIVGAARRSQRLQQELGKWRPLLQSGRQLLGPIAQRLHNHQAGARARAKISTERENNWPQSAPSPRPHRSPNDLRDAAALHLDERVKHDTPLRAWRKHGATGEHKAPSVPGAPLLRSAAKFAT